MSQTRIESRIYKIDSAIKDVFYVLSDFRRLGKLYELGKQRGGIMPPQMAGISDKIQGVRYEESQCFVTLTGMGDVIFSIVEREEPKLIKLTGSGVIPFTFTTWFQFLENAPYDTRMKITFEGELPMMVKLLLKGKLEKGLEQLAEGLSKMPFSAMRSVLEM